MPEEQSRLHEHKDFKRLGPRAGKKMCIIGRKLVVGDIIEETDYYEATSGEWLPAPCPGEKLKESAMTVWVRPS